MKPKITYVEFYLHKDQIKKIQPLLRKSKDLLKAKNPHLKCGCMRILDDGSCQMQMGILMKNDTKILIEKTRGKFLPLNGK